MMNRLSDRIVGHYERHATAWDADRAGSAWNDKPWHDRFVAMLPKGASILDLGCGSGSPVARHMAAQGLKITGVDSSPTLIHLTLSKPPARSRVDRWGYAPVIVGTVIPGHSGLGQLFPSQLRRSAKYV